MTGWSAIDFERIFRSHYRPLCLYALRFVEHIEDAEDVVQQVFADVWDKKKDSPPIDNIRSYLYRCVRNRSLNQISQEVTKETIGESITEMEDSSEEEQIIRAERDAHLWEAIDTLPPERKKIFLLAKRDGLKYQEIADELQISVKTVENQMGKALKTLRTKAFRLYCFLLGLP